MAHALTASQASTGPRQNTRDPHSSKAIDNTHGTWCPHKHTQLVTHTLWDSSVDLFLFLKSCPHTTSSTSLAASQSQTVTGEVDSPHREKPILAERSPLSPLWTVGNKQECAKSKTREPRECILESAWTQPPDIGVTPSNLFFLMNT